MTARGVKASGWNTSLQNTSSRNRLDRGLTSLLEDSERESHLTLARDALQWTIFDPVTIQRQNRWIKITAARVVITIASDRTRRSQLSQQTPDGFGCRAIFSQASMRGSCRGRGSKIG